MENEELFIYACKIGLLDIVMNICQNKLVDINFKNGLPLKTACIYGNLIIVKYLFFNKVDINIDNGAPLIMSLYKNNYEISKFLIENGADVNILDEMPLRICIHQNNLEMVKYLCSNGANIFNKYLSNSFLEKKIEQGNYEIPYYIKNQRIKINKN